MTFRKARVALLISFCLAGCSVPSSSGLTSALPLQSGGPTIGRSAGNSQRPANFIPIRIHAQGVKLIYELSLKISGRRYIQQLYSTQLGPITVMQERVPQSISRMTQIRKRARSLSTEDTASKTPSVESGLTGDGAWIAVRLRQRLLIQITTPRVTLRSEIPAHVPIAAVRSIVEGIN